MNYYKVEKAGKGWLKIIWIVKVEHGLLTLLHNFLLEHKMFPRSYRRQFTDDFPEFFLKRHALKILDQLLQDHFDDYWKKPGDDQDWENYRDFGFGQRK